MNHEDRIIGGNGEQKLEWPEFGKPELYPPLSPEQKRLEMEEHLAATASFVTPCTTVFPADDEAIKKVYDGLNQLWIATEVGVGLKIIGSISDPALLPTEAPKGHSYVHGDDLYIYDGDQWQKLSVMPEIPHPLDFGSKPWDPSEHQLAITTINKVSP